MGLNVKYIYSTNTNNLLQVMQTSSGPSIVLQGLHGYSLTPQQLALVQHQVKQQLLKGKLVHTENGSKKTLFSYPSIHWLHLYSSRVDRQARHAGPAQDVPGRAAGGGRAAAAHARGPAARRRRAALPTVPTTPTRARAPGNILLLDNAPTRNHYYVLMYVYWLLKHNFYCKKNFRNRINVPLPNKVRHWMRIG